MQQLQGRPRPVRVLSGRPCAPSRTLATVVVNGDGAARVKGDVKRVFLYLTDLSKWPAWYPGVTSATRTRGGGGPLTDPGTRFVLEQKFAGFQTLTTYDIASVEEYKRVVYRGGSKIHTVTDQFVLMPDPNDASFTVVRYMSSVQLQGQTALLQPVLAGILAKVPEEAMAKLSKLLSSAQSPLASIKVPSKQEARQTAGGGSKAGSSSSSSKAGRTQRDNPFLQSLGGLFSNLAGTTGSVASTSGTQSDTEEPADERDPRQYYRVLGLDATASGQLGPDEVKAAFRKLAQTMHPDKAALGLDDSRRAAAEMAFRAVQEAYEVLRDPEQKRAYDEGKLQSPTSSSSSSSVPAARR